jgi:hypothetical protein
MIVAQNAVISGAAAALNRLDNNRPDNAQNLNALKAEISNRKLVTWFIIVFGAFVLSLAVVWLVPKIFGGYEGVAISLAAIWGFVGGVLLIFILPSKVITATFGLLFGGGAQDIATGQGYLMKLEDWTIAAVPSAANLAEGFIRFSIVLLFSLIALLCVPAFFRD